MIISKTIIIGLSGKNIQHYKNKGYDLTSCMHKNDKGKMVVVMGSKIEVNVADLLPRSCQKVLAKCDNPECGKERWVEYDKYTDLCHSCALKTESYKINNGNANRGKKRTLEQREMMKRPHYSNRGDKSGRWDENKSDEERKNQNEKSRNTIEYREWRLGVFRKHAYQCQNCGYSGKKINAHHMESYFTNKKLRCHIENGIVLCKNCHVLFHSTYGKTGNHKYQIDEFLKDNKLKSDFERKEYNPYKQNRQGSKNINCENNSSIYVGVSKNKKRTTWEAGIYYDKTKYYLGMFRYEIEAAMAYNEAALEFWGFKANLNYISQREIEDLWIR